MKKSSFLALLVSLCALFSCADIERELMESASVNQPLTTSFVQTRTTIDGVSTKWAAGDKMTVFYTQTSGQFGNSVYTYQSNDTFDGKVRNLGRTSNDWYSVYPETTGSSPKGVSLTIPATQTQNGVNNNSHICGANDPLYGYDRGVAYGTTPNLQMHHVAATAIFNVTNTESEAINVNKLEFTTPVNIVGSFSGDLTAGTIGWNAESAQKKVTINVSNVELAAGASSDFYAAILPFSATGDYTIKVTATKGGQVITYTLSVEGRTLTYNQGETYRISISFKDDNAPVTPPTTVSGYELLTSEPSDWSGSYLLVSTDKKYLFNGENGNSGSGMGGYPGMGGGSSSSNRVSLSDTDFEGNVITNSAFSQYAFTITKSGSSYYFKKGSNYYYCSYSSNSSTGIVTTTSQSNAAWTLEGMATGTGGFKFYQVENNQNQYIYYKESENTFKFGQSGKNTGILLYKYSETTPVQPTRQDQFLSFNNSVVDWVIGSGYAVGGTYDPQAVTGASTPVTYTSSNASVATVSGNRITIVGTGTTTITATAAASDSYNEGSAQYTLSITGGGSSTGSYYVKVNSEPAKWDGTYLFVDENSKKAFAPISGQSGSNYAVSVNIVDGRIVASGDLTPYAITVSDAGKAHSNGNLGGLRAYNVRNSAGQYIYWSSNFGESTAAIVLDDDNMASNGGTTYYYYHAFKYNNGVQVVSAIDTDGGNAYYLGYNNGFSYDQDATSSRIQLYKLDGNGGQTGKSDQTLSFASSAVTWTLGSGYAIGGSYDIQTLNGAHTNVTYTSSNTNVAAVSGARVTIKAAGTTTITANAAESEQYNAGSAQYTLTIREAGSTSGDYFVKVNSAPASWDGTYLVVDENSRKAFAYNASSSYAVNVTISDGKIAFTSDLDQIALRVTDAGLNHPNVQIASDLGVSGSLRAYDVKTKDGKFIYASQSAVQVASSNSKSSTGGGWGYGGGSSSSTTYYHVFSYSSGSVYMISSGNYGQGNSSAQYYYSLAYSSNKFAYGQGNSKLAKVQLYKLNGEGGTDVPPVTPPGTVSGYELITSEPSDWSGSYLIVDDTKKNVFTGETGTSNMYSLKSSDFTGDVITGNMSSYVFTISKSGSSYRIKKGNNYYYCSYSSSSTGIATSTSAQNLNLTMLSGGRFGFWMADSSTNQYLYHKNSGSDNFFKFGGGGNSTGVCLYKYNSSSTPGQGEDDPGDTPTPSGTTFNLENSTLTTYLDRAASEYTNSNYSTTIVAGITGSRATLDIPNPVSLSWTGSATSISIYEGTSTSGTVVKNVSFSSSSSVEIYNLIPGKTYSYRTSNGQTGTFNTTGRRRMIKVSDNANQNHARNCRDFGGIKTAKGQTLKYGLMYRGTNMDQITSDEKNILLNELGILMDVDLRGKSGSGPLGSGVAVSGIGYTSGDLDNSRNDSNIAKTLTDILDYVIAGKPVYIHCQIGSDRTGYICMLLQALLGASKKECDIDYEITSFASGIVYGTRTKEYVDNKDFRVKFSSNADQTPQAVENYVVNTLKISMDKVKSFRRAMGVDETL